jgi:hypothetical protein
MTWTEDKSTGDMVWNGVEQGIAPSPLKGVAALKNVNISTETGEVMCNLSRSQQTFVPFTGQTLTYLSSTTLTYTGTISFLGWVNTPITIGAGITGLSAGNYYINFVSGSVGNQTISLTATYGGSNVSGMSAGSATFSSYNMLPPIASATEKYFDGTNIQYRYYILASNSSTGDVWVMDTGSNNPNIWVPVQINPHTFSFANSAGIAVLNGYLIVFYFNTGVRYKETCLLGVDWQIPSGVILNYNNDATLTPKYCLVGHTGTLNVTDNNYIATIFPNSSSGAGVANVFAYGTYTFSTYTLTQTTQIAGSFPILGQQITFTGSVALPTGISANTVYYVTNGTNSVYSLQSGTFSISATVGGSAISLSGTPGGTQYFNSFHPGVASTFVFNPQACTINSGTPNETAISLAELGNTLIIGTTGNTLYQWDEISPTWTNFIPLAESNSTFLLTVNNIVLIFAGTKGNIYVTSGSAASGVLTVPDYLAGIPGTPNSYIEPIYVFGQAIFIRGRVFFSIQDQTASKAGNCGGIYSFVPSFYNSLTGQDVGLALRMENENSYGTFNGLANVLLASQNQSVIGAQYWAAWTSDINTPTYGIDSAAAFPTATAIIETDTLNSGTMLNKKSFAQQEYKLAAPLSSTPPNIKLLLVGGGGGGGNGTDAGGGGGGGGVIAETISLSVSSQTYTINVGSGGAIATNGGNSTAFGITANGGGGGGQSGSNGNAGGSGGGASGDTANNWVGGVGVSGQGNNGGAAASTTASGAGGGGAGAVGGNALASPAYTGGGGGNGVINTISGTSITYGGGGGGGSANAAGSAGGSGGGGAGGGSANAGGNGIAGLGGGGGGSYYEVSNGGLGGSGIVIISAPIGTITSAVGGSHSQANGNDIWTFTSTGTWIPVVNLGFLSPNEFVQLNYRLNLTDAWTSCGTVVAENNSLSGYFTSVFQNTQWLQLQAQLIPNGTSIFSGNRLTEIRLR